MIEGAESWWQMFESLQNSSFIEFRDPSIIKSITFKWGVVVNGHWILKTKMFVLSLYMINVKDIL